MPLSGASIVRRTSTTDNYSTPLEAVYPYLIYWKPQGRILDPCSGEGNIIRAYFNIVDYALIMKDSFPGAHLDFPATTGINSVFSSDIRSAALKWRNDSFTHYDGVDLLQPPHPLEAEGVDWVITNPPFSLAVEVARRALELTKGSMGKVGLLLRIQFSEGKARTSWLKKTPLRMIQVFESRVSMYPEGKERPEKLAGTQCFAWFTWSWGYQGKPEFSSIDAASLEDSLLGWWI